MEVYGMPQLTRIVQPTSKPQKPSNAMKVENNVAKKKKLKPQKDVEMKDMEQ